MSSPSLLHQIDVTSSDGTRLRAWTNGGDGPTVLVSNGLGTNPHVWPTLLQPDSGVRVIGWYHRGIGGSERPTSGRLEMDAHLEDAVAVMTALDAASAVLVGWSIGVNVAFELATQHPERVRGILAVAGVPGGTLSTTLAPLRVPPILAKTLMLSLARSATVTGHAMAPVTRRIPWTRFSVDLLRMTRIVSPEADPALLQTAVQEFFATHPAWYARMALAASRHPRVSLSSIAVPTTFLAGRSDLLAGAPAMRSAAARIPGARYREVRGTHFIPLERPDVVLEELHALLVRVERAEARGPGSDDPAQEA